MSEIEPSAGFRTLPSGKSVEVTFNYVKHSSTHPVRRWMINGFYSKMLDVLAGLNPDTVLDAGCGEGYTLDRLAKARVGIRLTGIDGSPVAINLGKELFPGLNLQVGDIYKMPYKDNYADLVICTEVLEHLERPRLALQEMKRVSRRHLLLSVPNEPLFSLKNLIVGRNIRRLGSSKGHINQWTSRAFEKLVVVEGLKILSTSHPFPFTLLLAEK